MGQWKIIIAEDHKLLREGLILLFSMEPEFEIIGEAANGREAVNLSNQLNPDIILMDLSMPHTNGTDIINVIKKRRPKTKIVVLTIHKNPEYIRAAINAGASGYMLKDDSHADLITALRHVLKGKTYISTIIAKTLPDNFLTMQSIENTKCQQLHTLTRRERQITKLLAEGYRNKNIAEHLSISPKTVEKHRSNLMKKLNLHSISALTTWAIKNNLTTL